MSLAVKDLQTSKDFYEKLGFSVFAGKIERNYLIMKNGNALIGLFQGMFEKNMLTFNPGWDEDANILSDFDDVRAIQADLQKHRVQLLQEPEEGRQGPGTLMVVDPDGNPVLIDQHVG